MATQADTLSLVAQVVDQFSAPLRDMTRRLREFGDFGTQVHKTGTRYAKDHRNAFEDLRKSVKETSEHVRGVLTPAMAGLGLGAIGTGAAIAGVTAAIKEFAGSARDLTYLRTETGLSIDTLRQFDALAGRIGSSSQSMNQGFETSAANLEQWRNKLGPMREFFFTQWRMPGIRQFGEEVSHMTSNAEVLFKTLDFIKGMSEQSKRLFLQGMGYDPNLARATKEQLEDIKKLIGPLSDEQVKKGLAAQESFDRLRESVGRLKEEIGAELGPAMTAISDSIRTFVTEHGGQLRQLFLDIANAIRGFDWKGWAKTIDGIAQSLGGWGTVMGALAWLGIASWLAPIVTSFSALALAVTAIAGGSAAVAGLLGAGGIAAGAAGLALALKPQGLNAGEDERARQHRYRQGLGRGQRALMQRAGHGDGFHPISGDFADIAQPYRGEESAYKGTLKGAKEGILAAFQQLLNDRNFGLGGSGLGGLSGGLAGAGGGAGGGGSPTDDGSAPLGRAQAPGGSRATGGDLRSLPTPKAGGGAAGGASTTSPSMRDMIPRMTTPGLTHGAIPGGIGRTPPGFEGAREAAHAIRGGGFNEKSRDVMSGLMGKFGLTRQQAAGIVGNLGEESGGFKQYHEAGQAARRGGVGWAQWTNSGGNPRRAKFEAWTKAHGLDPRSDEASYRYLTEGDPQFPKALAAVKRESTVRGSMVAFERSFEGARIKAYGTRMHYAERAFDSYGSVATTHRQGLDASIRQRAAAAHEIKGSASVNVNFRNMPRGTTTHVKSDGIFKTVRMDRGRAAPMADTGGATER
jgi:hypothetical protein